MFSINSFALSKLNNAEFVAFFVNLKQMIDKSGAEELGLDEAVMTEFEQVQQKLIDQVYNTPGSEWTAVMKAADDRRDQVFKRIRLRLLMVQVAEKNSGLLACKDVVETQLLAKYGANVVSMPQHEESAVLQGFIYDLNTKLSEDDIDNLGIGSDISTLEVANNEFITAYNSRSDERAAGDTGLTLKLRGRMAEICQQVFVTVLYFGNSGVEAHAAKAKVCQAFIGSLNVVLADVKKRWNQRTGGAVSDEDDENGEGQNSGQQNQGSQQTPSGGNQSQTPSGGGTNTGGGTPSDDGNHVEF